MWRRQLLEVKGLHVMQLTMEEPDRDPIRFLSRLHAIVNESITDPAGSRFDTTDAGLELAFSELSSKRAPYVLVLDDVHVLKDSSSARMLQWLVDRQPDNVDLVVATREASILQLQHRLLRNELTRLHGDELALTEEETRDVVNRIHGLNLSASDLALLHRRTEGWPAAVRLAVLALVSSESPAGFLEGFAGSNRHVTDYLAEAVLENLDAQEVDFLMRVSVPDRINGDLARRLTGREDAPARLHSIERRNLFLVPLDQDRNSYRFHALFGEFLRARLRSSAPDVWQECLRAAQEWSIEEEDYEAAVDYALRAQRYDEAAEMLAEYAKTLVHRKGQHSALLGWIERIPARVLARYPQIQIHYSWSLIFEDRYSESNAILRRLRLEAEQNDSDDRDTLLAEVQRSEELNRISQSGLSDHAHDSVRLAENWLKRCENAEDYQRGIASVVLGYGRKTFHDWEGALAAAAEGREHYAKAQSPYGVAWGDIVRVVTLVKAGRMRVAHSECERSLENCRRVLGPNTRSYCMLSTYLAHIKYEFDELAACREALDYGARFIASQTTVDPTMVCYTTLALLYVHDGDPMAACEILHEGEQCGARRASPRLMTTMAAMRALVHLRCGDAHGAAKLLNHDTLRTASNPAEYHGVIRAKRCLLRIRLALTTGQPDEALKRLTSPIHHAQRTGQQRKQAELNILRGLAYQQKKATKLAHRSLQEALFIGAEQGLRRSFLDEGDALLELLSSYCESRRATCSTPAADTTLQWAESLLGEPETSAAARCSTSASEHPTLLGELTKRELQILGLLDSGLSNKKLADNLFVTEGTIKWHLHNIYSKLGVENRVEALNHARHLRLIR